MRLRPSTTLLPDALAPASGEHSVLEVVLRQLGQLGFARAVLAIGTLGPIVRPYVGDGSQWGLRVNFVEEESPTGTIQPLLTILDDLPDQFLLMSGDMLTTLNYADLLASHARSRALLTVAVYQHEHQEALAEPELPGDRLQSFVDLSVRTSSVPMGIYAVSRDALAPYRAGLPLTLAELMLDLTERGAPPSTYPFAGYWLDIGRSDEPGPTWEALAGTGRAMPHA
jgi:mannose-1-phosphate guanylyltransferase